MNLLSSLLMILLGRVYDGLMVDVQAVNQKLVRRSEDMLVRITGCSAEARAARCSAADGSVKLAVMLLHGCNLEEGVQLLDRSRGHLGRRLPWLDDAAPMRLSRRFPGPSYCALPLDRLR